jgi:hypothetical protein
MERYLLFIRDAGKTDRTDIHPSERDARKALAAYVRQRLGQKDAIASLEDDEAIEVYFEREAADYVIARMRKPVPSNGIRS